MCEFRKLLHHLNKRTAKPVCLFTVLNLTYAIAGFAYLIKTYVESNAPIKMFSMNVGNILLWLVIAFYPFFQVKFKSHDRSSLVSSNGQIFRLIL